MKEEQLRAIKERYNNIPDGYTISEGVKLIEQMSFDGIALFAEVERLREALEFYADENSSKRKLEGLDGESRAFYFDSPIMLDKGRIARKALEGLE